MSMATVVTSKPNEIILLKGNMPLEVRYDIKNNIITYASELGILHDALSDNHWWNVNMSAGEGLVIDSHDIEKIGRFYFNFDRSNKNLYRITNIW